MTTIPWQVLSTFRHTASSGIFVTMKTTGVPPHLRIVIQKIWLRALEIWTCSEVILILIIWIHNLVSLGTKDLDHNEMPSTWFTTTPPGDTLRDLVCTPRIIMQSMKQYRNSWQKLKESLFTKQGRGTCWTNNVLMEIREETIHLPIKGMDWFLVWSH